MRWLGLAALVLVATGCTVHVVEKPVSPVMVAEPAQPLFPRHAVAAGPRPHQRPPRTEPRADRPQRPARPTHPARPEPATVEPPRAAVTTARDVRRSPSKQLKEARAPRPPPQQEGSARPSKAKRLGRYDIAPDDVPPITDKPKAERPVRAPRSTSFAKPQQHAFDLRQ